MTYITSLERIGRNKGRQDFLTALKLVKENRPLGEIQIQLPDLPMEEIREMKEMAELEREMNIAYVVSAENLGRERGRREGLEAGKKEGRRTKVSDILKVTQLVCRNFRPRELHDQFPNLTVEEIQEIVDEMEKQWRGE